MSNIKYFTNKREGTFMLLILAPLTTYLNDTLSRQLHSPERLKEKKLKKKPK